MGKLRPRDVREPAGGHQAEEGAELGFEPSGPSDLLSMIHPNVPSALPPPAGGTPLRCTG